MTQKSAARKARDQANKDLKSTSCWDDVNTISARCTELLNSSAMLEPLMQDARLMSHVAEPATLAKNVRILATDLGTLHKELQGLKQLHVGKTGTAADPQELVHSIQVFEQYMMFVERHDALVMPTANHIAEQLETARQKMLTTPLTPEQDPEVVTDVAFSEAKTV